MTRDGGSKPSKGHSSGRGGIKKKTRADLRPHRDRGTWARERQIKKKKRRSKLWVAIGKIAGGAIEEETTYIMELEKRGE